MVSTADKNHWRVIVVENELNIRTLIKNFITRRYPDFEVVADLDNTKDALRLIEQDPEIHGVFLDIHFDCEEEIQGVAAGLDLACVLHKRNPGQPWVVLVTARAVDYGTEAHRRIYGQIGFLNKPINTLEWDEQIEWIRQNRPIHPCLPPPTKSPAPPKPIEISHRVITDDGDSRCLTAEKYPAEILYFHTNTELYNSNKKSDIEDENISKGSVRVKLTNGALLHKNNKPFGDWENELPSQTFFKINKSCIINLLHVVHVSDVPHFYVTLKMDDRSTERFWISDECAPKLKSALAQLNLSSQK